MHHYNMMNGFLLLFLVVSANHIVRSEIDLLAEPEVITLEVSINDDNNLLKETDVDLLHYDLLSDIVIDLDEKVEGDVTVDISDEGGDITDPSVVALDEADISTISLAADGEGPISVGGPEGGEVAAVTGGGGDIETPTEADNPPSTPTTDPRLERFAERLELLTLSPEERKLRKIELQLQKISVQNTEEEEKKREDRKQKILERREKKAQEKLEKKKAKTEKIAEKEKDKKVKISEKKKDSKKNVISILSEDINNSVENKDNIKENNFNYKAFEKQEMLDKNQKNVENKDNVRKKHLNNKELDKQKILDKQTKMRKEKKIENVEKRKAKHLRKGKDRNLRILQHMIHREEKGVPIIDKKKSRNKKTNKENPNRLENRRKKRDIKKWKNMKDSRIKRRKEIQFLVRLKRGFGAKLDIEHKKEVSQQLQKLKRKYKNDKNKVIDFQKNNWKLIEESKLILKLNHLKKKISALKKKKKQNRNTTNSNYKKRLSKRTEYFQNKYKEIKGKIKAMENGNNKLKRSERKDDNRNSSEYNTKMKKLKSKIEELIKMKRNIDAEKDPKHILMLKENIKHLLNICKKLRKGEKLSNATNKEKKAIKLKEKIKSLKKIWKEGVDPITETKLSKKINNLMERYKQIHNTIRYEKKNKCYLREDLDSINILKMQHIKAEIKLLKDRRKQIGNVGDPKQRAELTNTIRNLFKEYKKYKQLEREINETKTERKNRKLREQISSLMKMRKESKEQNVKTKLSKRIKKLIKQYKKTSKIIKYENKYECRYFIKLKNLKDKAKLLLAKRNQINSDTDSKFEVKLTNKIKRMIKVYEKYRKMERIRNETENERKLRELKEEIKSVSKLQKNSADLDTKTKLTLKRESLRKRYTNIYVIVRQETKDREQIKRSYDKRKISKYYVRMEKLKLNIKSLIRQKKQIGNEIDPKYKLKLTKRIKKLVNMYKKYKRLDKIRTETKKEIKSRILKEKIKSLNMKKEKSLDSNVNVKLSKMINGLMERYKKIHNIVKYEKKNKCYVREDYDSKNYLKMEKLKEEIKLLISKQKTLGSEGDPEQKINFKIRIRSLMKKYRNYERKEKIKKETKNEQKKRNLKEKIKSLMKMRRESEDQNTKANLSKQIKLLVKRYKKLGKITKYENKYECRNFRRVQQLKEKVNLLIREKRQISGDNASQQINILQERIKRLIKSYTKYNSMEKIRKETENGKKIRKLKEEIKSLVLLWKNATDLNVKTELSDKITTLKDIYTNIRLIVKYEEKDMEQISRSYESRMPSKTDIKMQKLKSKIRALIKEKKQFTNKVDPKYKLKLTSRITNLIRKYKKYKRIENKIKEAKYKIKIKKTNDKKNRKSSKDKYLEIKRKGLRQRRKYKSCKHTYKLEEAAKRKRKQKKLQLRKRRAKREKMEMRRRKDATRNWLGTCREQNGCGKVPVIPEGMAYCKSSQSNPGGSCQCWYLQNQM